MKSACPVHTGLQRPFTIFGLPPLLTVALAGVTTPLFATLHMIGLTGAAFIVWIALLAFGGFKLWRMQRANNDLETSLILFRRFWKGRQERTLVAGRVDDREKA